jgi:hypothetical protein
MKFETNNNVPKAITDKLYSSIESSLSEVEGMKVASGGDITIGELAVTVGCKETKPACLTSLSSYVEGDRIVFGSVQRSEDVYLFSMKMFDFAEERFVEKMNEQTVQGNPEEVAEVIPALVDGFLHGEVGQLKVDVSGASNANVKFDGEVMGPAPTTLKNLPLGQHAVTVKPQGGEEKTKIVVLKRGEPATVAFNFDGSATPPAGGVADKSGGTSPVPGFVAGGVGLAGVALAVAGQVQVSNNVSRGNEIMSSNGNYVKPGYTGQDAQEVDDGIRTGNTLRVVGASVGAVGLGVGGYLLYRHFSSSPESDPSKADGGDSVAKHFRVAPSPEGVHVGFTFDF